MFKKVSECNSLSCKDLTLSEKSAAVTILFNIYSSLTAANRAAFKSYTTIAQNLLSDLEKVYFVNDEAESFFSIADLALAAASDRSMPRPLAQGVSSFFTRYHNTYHSCYAFTLLRVLASLKDHTGPFVSVYGAYQQNEVVLSVVDVLDNAVSGVVVEVREGSETLPVVMRNNQAVIARAYKPGYHTLRVVVSKEEATLFDEDVEVLAPASFALPKVAIIVNKKETAVASEPASIALKAKDSVMVRATLDNAEFAAATAILVIESADGKKVSVALKKHDVGLCVASDD